MTTRALDETVVGPLVALVLFVGIGIGMLLGSVLLVDQVNEARKIEREACISACACPLTKPVEHVPITKGKDA